MRFIKTRHFNECFDGLPKEIKIAAKESFTLLKDHPYFPYHPSLKIKEMEGWPGIWEGHVTDSYVFTFNKDTDPQTGEKIWYFRRIGTHDIYKKP